MSVKTLKRFSHAESFDSKLFCMFNDKVLPSRDYIIIAAFDPGVVNTGVRIERRNEDGTITTLHQNRFVAGKKSQDSHYYVRTIEYLTGLKELLIDCEYILVESQMRVNPQGTRMAQHLISTILTLTHESPRSIVVEVLPTVKSKAFGAPRLKSKELKVWAVEKALGVLQTRGDHATYDLLKGDKKRDDHADVILYCDAWFRYLSEKVFKEPTTK